MTESIILTRSKQIVNFIADEVLGDVHNVSHAITMKLILNVGSGPQQTLTPKIENECIVKSMEWNKSMSQQRFGIILSLFISENNSLCQNLNHIIVSRDGCHQNDSDLWS